MAEPADPKASRRYLDNLRSEVDSAKLYRTLAEIEADPRLAKVYAGLASVEEAHVQFWTAKLSRLGVAADIRPSWRARTLAWLARRFGPSFVLATVGQQEVAGVGTYDNQPEAVAEGLPQAERSHARIVSAVARGQAGGGLSGAALAQLEGRHRGVGGNALRAAVLGANDGLVSNLSLVMGMAGAVADTRTILLTGLAGLVAGACSMALGEWLSVNSSRELYQGQIATEAEELARAPAEEREELVLIYQAKGLPEPEARRLAQRMMEDPKVALDALSREELGIDPDELGGSPWGAAGASFLLFAFGAIFPILPYFLADGWRAVAGSAILSGMALFGIGAATALVTGRGVAFSGLRQLGVGYGAAAVTFAIGHLAGVTLGG